MKRLNTNVRAKCLPLQGTQADARQQTYCVAVLALAAPNWYLLTMMTPHDALVHIVPLWKTTHRSNGTWAHPNGTRTWNKTAPTAQPVVFLCHNVKGTPKWSAGWDATDAKRWCPHRGRWKRTLLEVNLQLTRRPTVTGHT